MDRLILVLSLAFLAACNSGGSTPEETIGNTTVFDVTIPNAPFDYTINGLDDPTLVLRRGITYTFNLSAAGHPFYIMSVQGTNPVNAYSNGVTGNGNSTGQLIFLVPMNAPNTLYYDCTNHAAMTGTINVTN